MDENQMFENTFFFLDKYFFLSEYFHVFLYMRNNNIIIVSFINSHKRELNQDSLNTVENWSFK